LASTLAGPAKSAEPLHDFAGVWARASVGCDARVSGSLRNVDKATANKFHLIGICGNGFDLIHQPVGCVASKVVGRPNIVEFSAACRVKDYPVKQLHIRITVVAKDRISFNKKDFDKNYFYIAGEYQRCSRSFTCQEGPETQLEKITPQHPGAATRFAGTWVVEKEFPLACKLDSKVTYAPDGTWEDLYKSGTWRLQGDQLIEIVREVHEEPDSAEIGKSHASKIVWDGPDKVIETFSNGKSTTLRRCPPNRTTR